MDFHLLLSAREKRNVLLHKPFSAAPYERFDCEIGRSISMKMAAVEFLNLDEAAMFHVLMRCLRHSDHRCQMSFAFHVPARAKTAIKRFTCF